MTLQYILFVSLAPVSILVTGGILLYAIRRRYTGQTTSLIWLSTAILGWLILNTFELISHSAVWTVFWAKATYICISVTPVAWVGFAVRYTGRSRLSRFAFWLLGIIPIITIFIAFTNDYHHLLWTDYTFVPINDMLAMNVEHGPWFWVFAVYGYGMIFAGAAVISQHYFKPFEIYRRQSRWLLVGAMAPLISNIIYIFHMIPGLHKDYTPLSFVIASIAFTIDINQYRLFDLRPVARDLVIDSTTDAMITLDAQGRVVDLNPAAVKLQAEGIDVALGESLKSLFETAGLDYEPSGDATFQQDIVVSTGQGQRFFDLRSMPVVDRRDILVGRLIILRDISERKRAELVLMQQREELEARNRDLDAFAHTVAHDLKGPMGTTVGYASMLRSIYVDLPEDEFLESLDGIITSAVRMSEIVDALLLLSQVRKLEDVPIDAMDMGTMVIRALDRLEEMIEESGTEVVLPPNWPFTIGYGPWVEQVWVNYISNAIKYGGRPEQDVKPVIQLGWDVVEPEQDAAITADQAGDGFLRFWVLDNGRGLSTSDREQLFVEFSRLDNGVGEGHGLGLSIVKRIIEKLGGEVGVESHPDRGNTFYFTLSAYNFTKSRP